MIADTPAVVLGAGVNGLGVARSLAHARVPVWLLDTDMRRPQMHTRAAKPLPIRATHGEALVEELVRLGTTRFSGVRPVLLLTQEESVKTVSRHRDLLSAYYRFSLPPGDVVDTLLHKQGFQRCAEQLGSPVPPLLHIRTLADLSALEHLHYPVVVKPGERNVDYGWRFRKAYRVESAAEAAELVRRILPVMADVVVQEWIEGPDSNIYFCLQYLGGQGQAVGAFTGRKIRSWPPQVGGTASCTAAAEVHAELCAMTTRFFQAVGVIGMASMEYKRDARSGEFRMVEPTVGRTDYQEEVASLNGVNLPYAAWCSELGLPFPPPAAAKRPVVWRVRSEDMQSAAAQGQQLTQGYPRGGRVADTLCRWRDPMPCLAVGLQRVRRALHSRTSKMLPGSLAARSKS
ncbi:FAD-dependent oxidoreductase [Rhodanobacter thiooxydans]|uniref:FAD-dependent oxidoreductase n=1 Tax=Rhodanobacter thiooxydans TaxID=416169 RepID=A0A154QCR3_9GAMM|nr:FAD-dependent oxidoreductase [Rhodanobacter thiooxydans]EIM02183.1 ATPase [Rhodanobacter thiooxydans LCS2]KZC22028.1 FAD-dependent oxidoreductase [Rhodanobacter thiooxydans]MCW0200495.1 FAD-dependent oxidoreductase [Rhodanobacter thiooxydans]